MMENLNVNKRSEASNALSSLGSISKLSFNDSGINNHVFALNSSSSTNVQFSLTKREAAFVNEIGVFVVSDDKGTINGIAPGQVGYVEAALSQSRVIFSSLSEKAVASINFVRKLSFKAGERLGFYLVANNTTNSADVKIASGRTPDNVFFSLGAANSDKFDHMRVQSKGDGTFSLAWEDLQGGGDQDFNDLVLDMQLTNLSSPIGTGLQGQRQGEIIDLRSYSGQLSANFTFNGAKNDKDFVGFYKVNNIQGTVTDQLTGRTLAPDEVGYAQAAIRQSVFSLNSGGTSPQMLEGGGLLIPFIIANGNVEQFLSQNINTQAGTGIQAYFPYIKANADNLEHIRLLGDNTFAFESSFNSTNPDFNDIVFQVDFTVISKQQPINPGILAFSAASYREDEGNSGAVNKIVALLQRTSGSDGAVSVQVQLDDGSTVGASDYINNLPITVNFAAGEISKDVVIPIVGNTIFEADKLIKMKLLNPSGGASLGTRQTATYTIVNDDAAPALSINDANITEGNNGTTNATFVVSLSSASGQTVTVDYATANDTATFGSDYTAIPTTTLTFKPGETSKTIEVSVNGDTLNENDETFFVNLTNASNATITKNKAIGTIKNDDLAPIFNFSAATYNITEGDTAGFTQNAQVIVKRTNNTTGTDTVVLRLANGSTPSATGSATANAGIDYNNNPITVTFNSFDDTKTVLIPIAGDTIYEQNENIALTLSSPSSGSIGTTNPNAVLTIINDDAAPTVSITATATEATEAGITSTYTISRIGDASADLTVNLNIDASSTVKDTDYSLGGGSIDGVGTTRSVIIAAGQSSVTLTLTAINDGNAAEASETLKLNLTNNSAYTINSAANSATVTIAANGTKVINANDSSTDYAKMEGSLRQALLNANAFIGVDDITFNIPTTDSGYDTGTGMHTITLASELPYINDDVNIQGLGANKLTVSGNNAVRVFYINNGKTVNIDNLTIANGRTDSGGGGILNRGTLTITNSTLFGNLTTNWGGGGISNVGTLTVNNSTLSGNSANIGGGIYNLYYTLTVNNSTLSDNSAGYGGGIYNESGTIRAKNTIIAKNTATFSAPDFSGTLISQGYNLIFNTSDATIIVETTGNIFNVDPLLGSLQDNGGSNYTMALLSGSPAIDAGDPTFVTPPNTDQRGTGYSRVIGSRIDIGAFESDTINMIS